jgi:hypothetical protein
MPIQCRTYLLISHIALLRHQLERYPGPPRNPFLADRQ